MKDQVRFLKFVSSLINSFFKQLITVLLAIVVLLSFPFVIFLSIPFYIWRFLIAKLSKYLKPNLGKLVTARGQVFASDDLFNRPKSSIILAVTIEGNLEIKNSIEILQTTLLEAKLPSGELKYPELKQYLTTWMGYYFWKNDKTFDIKNHLILHEKCKLDPSHRFNDEEIQEIRQEVVQQKFLKKRPLWDLTMVTNCYLRGVENPEPHTTVILRFHHTLGDGYSWLFLLTEGLCKKPITSPAPTYYTRHILSELLYWICFPFRAAYNFAEIMLLTFATLPFRITDEKQTGKFNTYSCDRIPLRKIKEIKSHYEVSFASVVHAVLGGATREIMIKKGMKIPKTIPSLATLPVPNHTTKLRNYMTGALASLPTGEPDPIKRLKFSQADYDGIKRSTTPHLFKYVFVLIGLYCTWITKILGKNFMITTGLSNFPGGFENLYYDGQKCIDAMFSLGLQGGCGGLGFCCLSYVDGFRISPTVDAAAMTKEEVKELARLIEKQIEILYQNINNDV